jgi:DNA polymerase III epsilon subunit family exonuclease
VNAADPSRELPWTELSFVAVDVETTGFSAGRDRVIEVAWVRFERGREVERFSSLLCVDVPVPDAVRRLTGIHGGLLADKPRFSDVAGSLAAAIADSDFFVAYNAKFDRSFLEAEMRACNRALPPAPWVDPLVFLRDLESKHMKKSLVDAARRFGIPLPHAHRAEHDARATGELLLKLAPRLAARTLVELVDKQARWAKVDEEMIPDSPPTGYASIGARLMALFR